MSDAQPVYILDSYAMLAYLGGEEGGDFVKEKLEEAQREESRLLMSLINLGEVLYISERGRGLVQAQKALGLIEQLPLEVVDAGKERVLAAAHIKARYPVAYADAFAAGLAQEFGGTVLTDDPEFGSLKDLISVRRLGGE